MRLVDSYALYKNVFSLFRCLFECCMLTLFILLLLLQNLYSAQIQASSSQRRNGSK